MKPKDIEKHDSKNDEFLEDNEFLNVSWEDSLGKEVQLFWESISDDFEE